MTDYDGVEVGRHGAIIDRPAPFPGATSFFIWVKRGMNEA